MDKINTLDLLFLGNPQRICAYIIPYTDGAVLVDCGPTSTLSTLGENLKSHGLTLNNVTHVLLTHIHLDHAGAAGLLANSGAEIYVHPFGEKHLLNPEKLLNSAKRLYGEKMESIWGKFMPVPLQKLKIVKDEQEIVIGSLRFTTLYIPGHAEHHVAYLFEDTAFTGDIAGIRSPQASFIQLPLVPPELNIDKWRLSLRRLMHIRLRNIALAHFGYYSDAGTHLSRAIKILDETEHWLGRIMSKELPIEILRQNYIEWQNQKIRDEVVDKKMITEYEIENSSRLAAEGLYRYWHKMHIVG